MKEIFQGNITKETADLIKELSAGGGGSTGVVEGYSDVMLDDYDLLADNDISSYLPESTVEAIPPENLTDSLGRALEEAVNDGVNFYVQLDSVVKKATIQNIYSEEDPTEIISVEITSDAFDEPDYWVANNDSEYSSDCFSLTDTPLHTFFDWYTEPLE